MPRLSLPAYSQPKRARREGWEPEDDVRFTAAYHFAKAHQYSRMLRAKRKGDTGPGMDE